MKFILALALFIGAVAAQTPAPQQPNTGRALAETLEKRAAALLQYVRKELEEHRGFQRGHLIQTLEREAVLVEALNLDLQKQLADKDFMHHLHHIHVIEEDLLHMENRVSEEIMIIRHFADGNHQPNGETGPQLIARGQKLVQDAKDAVAKHPKAKEVREINSEIIVVEALVKAITAKPAPSAAEMKKDEEELARQEKTLRQLIEKAVASKP